MNVASPAAPRQSAPLPVIVGGFGPGGAAASLTLVKELQQQHGANLGPLDQHVMAFEGRGPEATRARNIYLRPEGREILQDLTGNTYGYDTTIMAAENDLRAAAKQIGLPVSYEHEILDVADKGDHVEVQVRDKATGAVRTVNGSTFIDASGGRIKSANAGPLERSKIGTSHVYVTAQYDTPSPFPKSWGAYDRETDHGMFILPVHEGKSGFVTYYDMPPDDVIAKDEAERDQLRAEGKRAYTRPELVKFHDDLAARLQLGTPVGETAAFDAQHHMSQNVKHGNIVKIGDSVGSTDPFVAGGFSAALADARDAVKAIVSGGSEASFAHASDQILDGHRNLGWKSQALVSGRDLALYSFPKASFATITPAQAGESNLINGTLKFLSRQSVRSNHSLPGLNWLSDAANGAMAAIYEGVANKGHLHLPEFKLPSFGSRS